MPRSMLSSFTLLVAIVVMTTLLTSVYLFSNGKSSRRHVHLISGRKNWNDDDQVLQPHRLFDVDEEETRGDEWMKDFVLKGDIAQPHRQPAKAAVRKFDPGSASLPNSDDDYVGKEAENPAVRQIDEQDRRAAIEDAALGPKVPKVPVNDRQYDDQASRFSEGFQRLNREKRLGEVCRPSTRVAMIKTHKCSSSTLQNILLRKAEDLNLTVAIPKENVYFGSPSFFSRRFIFLDDGRQYDMMASHMRFRGPKDVQEVMKPGAKYVTILRDPVKQFESIFTYYGWRTRFHADIHRFLQLPDRYFQMFEPKFPRVAGRNPMCYDNGLDARRLSPDDPTLLDGFINILARWYDLVLIAEYFDESLILLKDLMCWTLDDVVYFSQNARNKVSVVSLTRGDHAAIRRWNWADQKLYEHFNATLWEKIDAYGRDRMREDLDRLAAKKTELSKDCIGRVVRQGDKRMWYPHGIKVNSFLVNENAMNKHLCEQLTRPELVYLGKFRENMIRAVQRKQGRVR